MSRCFSRRPLQKGVDIRRDELEVFLEIQPFDLLLLVFIETDDPAVVGRIDLLEIPEYPGMICRLIKGIWSNGL